jgi:hypothetical protein
MPPGQDVAVIPRGAEARQSNLGEDLRELLDHIAVELAEEYVRLMEAAAENEARCAERRPMAPPQRIGGGR